MQQMGGMGSMGGMGGMPGMGGMGGGPPDLNHMDVRIVLICKLYIVKHSVYIQFSLYTSVCM